MSGILSRIVAAKKVQLEGRKASLPEAELEKLALASPLSQFPLREALRRPAGEPIRVLAECKKASPSKGVMIEDYDPLKLARAYHAGGASGISVLTETEFFLGSDEHLRAVVQAVPLPVLRKDFTIERYQLLEARCLGASAILLIAACLDASLMRELSLQARELGLDVLVEIHHPRELDPALEAEPSILGINNRDLDTFRVSLDTTFSLLPHLPAGTVTISESGISSRIETDALEQAGVDAILCGEGVGTSADPESKVRELRGLA